MKIDKYDKTTQPQISKVKSKNVPKELKQINQWVCWRWIWKGSKWTKPPCDIHGNVIDHHKASYTFKQVLKAHKKNPDLGIGISMREGDQICGIDIDPGPDGKIPKALKKAVKSCPSYSEISPSGTGYRIFGLGSVPTHGSRTGSFVESYDHGRYLTVTGDANGSAGKPLVDISEVANWMIQEYGAAGAAGKINTGQAGSDGHAGSSACGGILEVKPDDYLMMMQGINPDSYDDWLQVGMALHYEFNGSLDGLRHWDKWSRGSEKYAGEDDLEKKWKSFGSGSGDPCTGLKIKYLYEQYGGKVQYDEPQLVPFDSQAFLFENQDIISTEILPPHMREVVQEVARFVKTSESLIVTTLLGIFSAAIAKRVDIVERGSIHHQASLGFFQGIPTGGRKSGVDNIMMRPFYGFEKSEIHKWREERPKIEAKLKGYKDQIAFMRKQIRAGASGDELDDLLDQIGDLEKKIVQVDQPAPRLICSDVTEEELSNLMYENQETMFVSSDEGANVIKNITGRYSSGENMSIYICGLTGSHYKRYRVTSKRNIDLDHPCINLSVKVQKDPLLDLVSSPSFEESGLAARLFLGVFDVQVSSQYRIRGEANLREEMLKPYEEQLLQLLGECHGLEQGGHRKDGLVRFQVTGAAYEAYENFSESYADNLDDGKWQGKEEITNKVVSRSMVMAAILSVIWDQKTFIKKLIKSREKGSIQIMEISKEIYELATTVVMALTEQTVNVLDHARRESEGREAMRIVKTIKADIDRGLHGGLEGSFAGSLVSQKMSKALRPEWREYLDLIVGHGYFVETGKGKYKLNQEILNGGIIS